MSCGVGHRCSSYLALLWLWCRLAAAAPIRPLAWDSPYATGATLKRQKDKKEINEVLDNIVGVSDQFKSKTLNSTWYGEDTQHLVVERIEL